MALQLIAAIRKSGKPYLIDVMGLPGVLAPLLVTDEAAKAQIPDQMEHYNDICRKVAREVIAHAEVHRLLLFETPQLIKRIIELRVTITKLRTKNNWMEALSNARVSLVLLC